MGLTPPELPRWTPIRVHGEGPEPVADWAHLGGIPFDEPFLDETVQQALRHPFRLLFRHETDLVELEALVAESPGLPVSGFCFHLSRCGSTLVSRSLGALPSVLSISEPAALGTALFLDRPQEERIRWCRALVRALTQPRSPEQRTAVLKLDAWATFALPVVRAAYPEVPWVFLHRDPVEVLVSHHRRRGAHVLPGALDRRCLDIGPDDVVPVDLDEYAAWVLGRIVQAAAAALDEAALVVGHAELPDALTELIAPHFDITLDAEGRARIDDAARLDAKNPVLPYVDDRAAKAAAADERIRAHADRWLQPALDELLGARR
jgi:hypothetical protein